MTDVGRFKEDSGTLGQRNQRESDRGEATFEWSVDGKASGEFYDHAPRSGGKKGEDTKRSS